MITHFKDILNILISPIDKSSLKEIEEYLVDSSNNKFRNYNNNPILINFDESVIDSNINFQSPIQRNSFFDFFKRALSQNKKSEKHTLIINDLLLQKKESILLIIGGGSMGNGTEKFYSSTEYKVISFDIYASPYTTLVADAHSIPLKDGSVDAVWIQAVLEHVINPEKVVSEIYRVLKDAGYVYAEVPFMQPVHEGAYDFKRYSHSGLRYLFKDFSYIGSGSIDGPGSLFRWALKTLFEGIFQSRIVGKVIFYLTFFLSWIDRVIPEKFKLDTATGYYFWGQKSKIRITDKEIIQFYKGSQS